MTIAFFQKNNKFLPNNTNTNDEKSVLLFAHFATECVPWRLPGARHPHRHVVANAASGNSAEPFFKNEKEKNKKKEPKMTTPEDVHLQWDEQTPPFDVPLFNWDTRFPVLLQQPMVLPQCYLNKLEPISAVNYHQLCQRIPKNSRNQDMDYSAEAFYIIKIIDREIMLSLAQWFRQILGITMPDFYMIFEKGKHANYHGKDKNKKINFNHCQRNKKTGKLVWKATSLGQLCTCVKTYCKRHKIVPFEKANSSFFWKLGTFVSVRNRLFHTSDNDPFTLAELYALKNDFDNFMLSYLPDLYMLKKKLSEPQNQANDTTKSAT